MGRMDGELVFCPDISKMLCLPLTGAMKDQKKKTNALQTL